MIVERNLRRLALFVFFLTVFLAFVYTLRDPDLPWHLLTGQYILTNRTIPMSSDPFSFATGKISSIGGFILSENWVAQSLFFIIYRYLGPLGLVLTRAVVFTLIIAIIWYLVYRKKGALIALLSSGTVAFLTIFFSGIRPQIFTFLFSAVLILLIERYRDTRSVKWLYPMPLLMLVWANMHGGFIYGVVLIFVYLFGTAAELLLEGRLASPEEDRLSSRQFTLFLVFGFLSVLFSLINPNTYEAFVFTFMSHIPGYNVHNVADTVLEYRSAVTYSKTYPSVMIYGFWVCVACAAVMAAVFIKRRQPTQLLLLIFAVTPALVAVRYIPLFLIVAAPLLAYMPRIGFFKPPAPLKVGLWTVAIVLFSFVAISYNPFRSRAILVFNESFDYPVGAANFLLKNGIKGNIFASYITAAFINFKCYPGSRIYFDGRFVDVERIIMGNKIEGQFDSSREILASINRLLPAGIGNIKISRGGRQRENKASWNDSQWKELLDKIGADIIVHEAVDYYTGIIYPFVFKLARDDTWKLIYADGTVMIFVRNEPKFKDVIAKYQLPKSRIYDEMLKESEAVGPRGKRYYSTTALALLLKGIADKHTSFYIDRALSRDPKDLIANYSKVLYLLMTQHKEKGS